MTPYKPFGSIAVGGSNVYVSPYPLTTQQLSVDFRNIDNMRNAVGPVAVVTGTTQG